MLHRGRKWRQRPLIMVKSDISLSEPTARALALFSSWLGW